MWTRFAVALAFVLTACMGSFNIQPGGNSSGSPTPTALAARNPMPSASAQASATPQTAMSAGPSVAPSTAKTVEPLKSPTPRPTSKPSPTPTPVPTPTPRPKTLWTQVVPGVEVMDDSVLLVPGDPSVTTALVNPRRVSGVVVRTLQDDKRELWVQFNHLPIRLVKWLPCNTAFSGPDSYACSSYDYAPGFVAYDPITATWSLRVMGPDFGCSAWDRDVYGDGGSQYQNFRYLAPCHPDDYPGMAGSPVITADGSQSFTVKVAGAIVATVSITEDFARVLHTPDYYAYYKTARGVSSAGHSAWHNDRLYYTTQYRNYKLSYQEWSNIPRVIAWWSKSDNSWRVTELPFAKNTEVRGRNGALQFEQPLYMAIDPNSDTFFFVVPEHLVLQVYRSDRIEDFSRPVPFSPRRLWGTLYKVSASFIHDNGVLVSVK